MEPLISVIVPVYKVERYLDRCLESITGQTYHNLEILLVDDGSPDDSGAICDRWAARDSRIRVLHQENQGAGAARNAALDLARGDFIGFVDSDDYVSPDFYAYLYFMMDGDTDITECGYLETQGDDAIFDDSLGLSIPYTPKEAMEGNIRDTVFRQLIWNKLYRRKVMADVRFPVGTAIDDEFFTYRALAKARSLVRCDTVLYAYRQQEESIMHRPYSIKRLNGIRAKGQRLALLEEKLPELVPLAKNDLVMSCLYGMQGTLRSLTGEERQQAEKLLEKTLADMKPLPLEAEESGKRRVLLRCAGKNLKGTAWMLNLLENLHILN